MTGPRVVPGQRFRAEYFNRLSQEADQTRHTSVIHPGNEILSLPTSIQGFIAFAYNVGSVDLSPYEVGILSAISNTTEPDAGIDDGNFYQIAPPTAEDNHTLVGVCLDPIAVGEVGRVVLMGMAWAYASGTPRSFASLVGTSTILQYTSSGPFQVLCQVPVEQNTLALVRFPFGTGGDATAVSVGAHAHQTEEYGHLPTFYGDY